MAQSIGFQHDTSGLSGTTALYAFIRAITGSDSGEIADVVDSHMETYSTAAIANYDTDLTEQGTASRYYDFTVPSFLADGLYRVDVLKKSGSTTPAETDTHVAEGFFEWDGTSLISVSGTLDVNVTQISGDSTAADNLEADYDGTGYTKTNSQVGLLTATQASIDAIETDTNSLNDTKIPDTISLANINGEVDTALTDIGLDHLVSTSVAGADVADNSIFAKIVSSSATADWDSFVNTTDSLQAIRDKQTDIETDTQAIETDTQDIQARLPAALVGGRIDANTSAISGDSSAADNLEKEYDGTGFGPVLVRTTIGTLASQTSFTLSAGSVDDDAYNDCVIVIEDATTAAQKAVGVVDDYTGSTKTVTLRNDPGVFTMAATDIATILADRSLKPTVDTRSLDVTATGTAGVDWGNVENQSTTVDLSDTSINLCDTITTYTGDTPQTGDNFARIGINGAGLSAIPWNASWDTEVQSEVDDALVAQGLDHLVGTSVAGTDIADDSIIAQLVSSSATADWDSFDNTTDSLQAIRDRGDSAWTTSTFSITAAAVADAVWDEAQADHVAAGSFGETATEIAAILVDTGTTLDGKIDTIDGIVDSILVDTGTTLPATLGTPADTDLATDIANVRGADNDTLKTLSDQLDGLDTDALLDTTVSSVTSQTILVLSAGATLDDVYNGSRVVLYDANGDVSQRLVTDYVGSTKTLTIDSAADFTVVATDQIKLFRRSEVGDSSSEVTVGAYNTSLDFNSTQKASINAEADTALTDYDAIVPADLPTNFADLSITATTGRVDVASIEGSDATDQIRDAVVDDSTRFSGADIAAILADTASLDGTKIPDVISLANINSQVDTALTDIGLDHLFSAAIIGTDVTDNSFAAQIVSKSATADFDSFDNTNDSLEAIRDSQADSAPTAAAIADAVWDEATTGHTTSGTFGEQLKTDVDAILVDTNELQTDDVPGLIAALNNISTTQVNAEVDAAIETYGLDHLVSASVTGTDIADNSIIAYMASKSATADWDSFANTTDSLEALRDNQPNAGPTAAVIADAVWDEAQSGHVASGSFGEIATEIAEILVDTGTTLDGKIDTIDTNVDAILVDTGTTLDGKIDTLDTNVDSLVTAVITNAAGVDISADIAAVKAETADIVADTNELQGDWADGGRLDLLLDQLIAELVTVAGEPSQGAPPETAKRGIKLDWIYTAFRNKTTQDSSDYKLYADDGTTVIAKAGVSDDGTTFTRQEIESGP